ncbi:MAG: DNA mismatch repair protein MutS [Bacteroidota bacterium]
MEIAFKEDTLKLFDFNQVKLLVENYARTKGSKQLAKSIFPVHRNSAYELLQQTAELHSVLLNKNPFPDTLFEDFEAEANLLFIQGSVLTEKQFISIKAAAEISSHITKYLKDREELFPALHLLFSTCLPCPQLIKAIDVIIDEQGSVRSSASKELANIRHDLDSKRREVDRKFRNYINHLKKQGWLRDSEESFYNGRRVLSVVAEHKRDVKGIIHGSSETGRTAFIEPIDNVELNNDIIELEQEEKREVFRILKQLTQDIREHKDLIKNYYVALTHLDFTRAKALVAIDLNACLPKINKQSTIKLVKAYHPLLYLQNKTGNKSTMPLSVSLDKNNRILVISGPNAGGKSVALKTIGLLQIMLQSGLLVSCMPESEMCFFNELFVDIGDSQSIENELSTYSSRLVKTKLFLEKSNARSLVLIDEFGTGTDPELGGAMAETVLEELNKKQALGILTTHYTNVKVRAEKLAGVINGSMLFDVNTLLPTYQLSVGQPGSSYTFEVAEKIGFPKELIQQAKAKVSDEKIKLNQILVTIQKEKNAITNQLNKLREKEKQLAFEREKYDELAVRLENKLLSTTEKQTEIGRLADMGRKLKLLAEEWESSKDKKAVIQKFVNTVTAEKKLKEKENTAEKREKRKQKAIEQVLSKISVGVQVRLVNTKLEGEVIEVKKTNAKVIFGDKISTVSLENLQVL